jgi:hypothetical protein
LPRRRTGQDRTGQGLWLFGRGICSADRHVVLAGESVHYSSRRPSLLS